MEYRKVNADLHTHLMTGSDMGNIDPNKVVYLGRKRLGAGGILGLCNTRDHRYERFVSAVEHRSLYSWIDHENALEFPELDFWVVKGQEVNTKQGEFVVLGLNKFEDLTEDIDLGDSLEEAKEKNTCSILVHPFYRDGTWKSLGDLFNEISIQEAGLLVDGFEVYNSNAKFWIPKLTPFMANKKALEYYEFMDYFNLDIGAAISSDNHLVSDIGISYTTIEMPQSNEIDSGYLFISHLRDAVKDHKNLEGKMQGNWIGAARHALAAYGYYGPIRLRNWLRTEFI